MPRRRHPLPPARRPLVHPGRYLFETPCERVRRHIQVIRWQIADAQRTGGEDAWVRELKERLRELWLREREVC